MHKVASGVFRVKRHVCTRDVCLLLSHAHTYMEADNRHQLIGHCYNTQLSEGTTPRAPRLRTRRSCSGTIPLRPVRSYQQDVPSRVGCSPPNVAATSGPAFLVHSGRFLEGRQLPTVTAGSASGLSKPCHKATQLGIWPEMWQWSTACAHFMSQSTEPACCCPRLPIAAARNRSRSQVAQPADTCISSTTSRDVNRISTSALRLPTSRQVLTLQVPSSPLYTCTPIRYLHLPTRRVVVPATMNSSCEFEYLSVRGQDVYVSVKLLCGRNRQVQGYAQYSVGAPKRGNTQPAIPEMATRAGQPH